MNILEHDRWMQRALELADNAVAEGEVPVGAVVVRDGEIIGEGWNQVIGASDPSAHAEVVAIRAAAKNVGNYRLLGAALYVTLEPCAMCAGVMVHARIAQLMFAASEPKAGVVHSACSLLESPWFNHKVEVLPSMMAAESAEKLQQFFAQRRVSKSN